MQPKSPISEVWERLVTTEADLGAAREPSWRALYDSCFCDEQWTVNLRDAELVTHLGVTIMLQAGRYHDASTLAERYFRHPDTIRSDWGDWAEITRRLGQSKILEGKTNEGIALLRGVLDSKCERNDRMPTVYIRNSIYQLCLWNPKEAAVALPQLVELGIEVLKRWPNCPDDIEHGLQVRTVKQLRDVLEATYPPRKKNM